MEDELIEYYNKIVNNVTMLSETALAQEARIHGISDRTKHSEGFFLHEMTVVKNLIYELDSFVQSLLDKFGVLSKSTEGFVSKEELEHLQTEVNKLQLEKLILRKRWKEKLLKSEVKI